MADTGMLAWISVALFACLSLTRANEYARGWGDNIDWMGFEEGLQKAKTENRPLMLVIHKSWCGACKALKPKFAASESIKELSGNFVMVNVQDDEEPNDNMFKPDGGYIPRILFLDPEGNVQKQFINEGGNASYKFYFPSIEDITKVMEKVLQSFKDGKFSTKKEEL